VRTPLVMITALAASLLLAACVGVPDDSATPAPTPSSSSSASAAPSPAAPAPTPSVSAEAPAAPASIIIGVSATDIVDASGDVLLSIDYSDDGDQSVANLIELLGPPTSTRNVPQNPHFFETDISTWDGFEIGVMRPSSEAEPMTQFYIEATGATSSGLAIAAVDGTQVGDSYDEALAGIPEWQTYNDPNYPPRAHALQVSPDEEQGNIAWGLIVEESAEAGVIGVIKAPDYVYDAA
jgi:hypothetical protein